MRRFGLLLLGTTILVGCGSNSESSDRDRQPNSTIVYVERPEPEAFCEVPNDFTAQGWVLMYLPVVECLARGGQVR